MFLNPGLQDGNGREVKHLERMISSCRNELWATDLPPESSFALNGLKPLRLYIKVSTLGRNLNPKLRMITNGRLMRTPDEYAWLKEAVQSLNSWK